jgi:hypothetical protein
LPIFCHGRRILLILGEDLNAVTHSFVLYECLTNFTIRPLIDGPALRSTALITYANYLLANDNFSYVTSTLWPILKIDLDYVSQSWNETTCVTFYYFGCWFGDSWTRCTVGPLFHADDCATKRVTSYFIVPLESSIYLSPFAFN